jgi:hypothetical protein
VTFYGTDAVFTGSTGSEYNAIGGATVVFDVTTTVAAVPEPASLALLAARPPPRETRGRLGCPIADGRELPLWVDNRRSLTSRAVVRRNAAFGKRHRQQPDEDRGRDTGYPMPPGTDPSVRNSRTGLPPWVSNGEALVRPRMKDSGFREPGVGDLRDPLVVSPDVVYESWFS